MQFNKTAYKTAKERVISLIKGSHDWEKTEGFIADGLICPDVYEKQPVRILCILAESYGYNEDGMVDIEDQPKHDILGLSNPKVQTPRRLASLLYLLQSAIEKGTMPELEQWRALKLLTQSAENTATLQEALAKVAWVNVKKASNGNGSKLDATKAHSHARRNEVILREQIQSIAPDLIFVCGQVTFSALLNMALLGPKTVSGRGWQIQDAGNGTRVMELSHPAYFRDWNSYDKIYRNYKIIHSQLS